MHTDTTLKDLLWQGAPGLLRELTGQTAAEILPTEYADTRCRRPDFVARLTDGRLFHLELQATSDADMAMRMLEYYGMISRANGGEPVTQMVLALSDAVAQRMPEAIDHPGLRLSYAVVSLESMDAGPLLASGRADDAVLAILCGSADIRDRIRAILIRLAGLETALRRDAITRLMVLAGFRRVGLTVMEEARTMAVRLDIRENDFLMHVFSEGRVEGHSEGRVEGRSEMLLRMIAHRFGPVSEPVRARVRAADADRLDAWADGIFEATSLDDLLNRAGPADGADQ